MTTKIENGDSKAYWEGVREGRLLFQQCYKCQAVQFPPRYFCASCWETDISWIESTGKGHIESCTVVHRAPSPDFQAPYVIAMVKTDENVRIMTNIIGPGALEATIGDEVKVTFAQDHLGRTLPQFERAVT